MLRSLQLYFNHFYYAFDKINKYMQEALITIFYFYITQAIFNINLKIIFMITIAESV